MNEKTKLKRLIIFVVSGVFLSSCLVVLLLMNSSLWAKLVA